MSVFLSLVIPAYNEEQRLIKNLPVLQEYFERKDFSYEVIVVNDGSRDGTESVVLESQKTWPELKLLSERGNHGKGYSVRKGMLSAEGRYIVFSDADLSSPIRESEALLSRLMDGCDVAAGSRYIHCDADAGKERVTQSFLRHASGKMFSFLVRLLVSPRVSDTQCGFKGFTAEAARELFSRQKLNGFAFDVEILYLSRRMGMNVSEVPVEWHEDPHSKISLFRDAARMLFDVVRIHKMHFKDDFANVQK